MATRNLYVKLSKALKGRGTLLIYSLIFVSFGGFLSIILLSKLTSNPQVVNIGGRVWFSTCALLVVMLIAVANFNPERDMAGKSLGESWQVIVLNLMAIAGVYVWFM